MWRVQVWRPRPSVRMSRGEVWTSRTFTVLEPSCDSVGTSKGLFWCWTATKSEWLCAAALLGLISSRIPVCGAAESSWQSRMAPVGWTRESQTPEPGAGKASKSPACEWSSPGSSLSATPRHSWDTSRDGDSKPPTPHHPFHEEFCPTWTWGCALSSLVKFPTILMFSRKVWAILFTTFPRVFNWKGWLFCKSRILPCKDEW